MEWPREYHFDQLARALQTWRPDNAKLVAEHWLDATNVLCASFISYATRDVTVSHSIGPWSTKILSSIIISMPLFS